MASAAGSLQAKSATSAGALILTAGLVREVVPEWVVAVIFGRVLTEPLGLVIPKDKLALYAMVSSATVFCSAGLHGAGVRNPFVAKVYKSAGFGKPAAQKTLDDARAGRYDRACQHLHPGKSCWHISGLTAVMRASTVDVAFFGLVRTVINIVVRGKPTFPKWKDLARTWIFCTLCFSSIRALSCLASNLSRRIRLLNNSLVTNTLLPLWFSLGLYWVKLEPYARQRQITLFSLAGAAVANLRLLKLWPATEMTNAVVTGYLFPFVLASVKKAIDLTPQN